MNKDKILPGSYYLSNTTTKRPGHASVTFIGAIRDSGYDDTVAEFYGRSEEESMAMAQKVVNALNAEVFATEKMMLYRTFYDPDDRAFSWWCWLDAAKDRITGKWRIDGGDVVIEVAHGRFKGFFKKRWVEEKVWYVSDDVKFVSEFGCANHVEES